MFDTEFKKIYDNAKDSSWPDIHEYKDFVNLDSRIKNEMFEVHGLQNRINEITDSNYWNNSNNKQQQARQRRIPLLFHLNLLQ